MNTETNTTAVAISAREAANEAKVPRWDIGVQRGHFRPGRYETKHGIVIVETLRKAGELAGTSCRFETK